VSERRSAIATLQGPAVRARTFELEERIRYSYSRPVTDLCQYLRIVPPTAHGPQRRRSWHLAVEGVESSTVRTFFDAFGNLTVAVSVPRVDDAVQFVLRAEAETEAGISGSPHRVVADRRFYEPTPLTAPDATIAEMADSAGPATGAGFPDVAALCERVHRCISYKWGITGVQTTASEALAGGRGVCQDYAHIMLAACRLAGVPARYVSGHLTGEGGSHAWVEVLRPQTGRPGAWTAEGWDPTHNRRTDANYLVIAIGRDYTDAAPMWGTFEGDDVSSTLAVEKRLSV
jgi:transglutaminase-like putative cysteine protease